MFVLLTQAKILAPKTLACQVFVRKNLRGDVFGGCRFLGDRLNLYFAVALHACAGRQQFTDDDVFFQADQRIGLALDCGIGQNTRGFLEGCGGQERIRSK